jgi:hypothetical protein
MERRNPQVNCDSYDCYYNRDGICVREGIHASKKSCYCFIHKKDIQRL